MENENEEIKKEDDLAKEKGVSRKVPISELAKQIEKGEVNLATLDKKVLRQYVLYRNARGYDNYEIAEILGCTVRTVQRYVKHARRENWLNVDQHLQREIAKEFYDNWKLQYRRLLKLSYSEGLSDPERAKIICALHQLEISGIATLERLGYISQEQGIEDIKDTKTKVREIRMSINAMQIKTILATLKENTKRLEEFEGSEEDRVKLMIKISDEENILSQKLTAAYAENIELENSKKNETKQPYDPAKGIWQYRNRDGSFRDS